MLTSIRIQKLYARLLQLHSIDWQKIDSIALELELENLEKSVYGFLRTVDKAISDLRSVSPQKEGFPKGNSGYEPDKTGL